MIALARVAERRELLELESHWSFLSAHDVPAARPACVSTRTWLQSQGTARSTWLYMYILTLSSLWLNLWCCERLPLRTKLGTDKLEITFFFLDNASSFPYVMCRDSSTLSECVIDNVCGTIMHAFSHWEIPTCSIDPTLCVLIYCSRVCAYRDTICRFPLNFPVYLLRFTHLPYFD